MLQVKWQECQKKLVSPKDFRLSNGTHFARPYHLAQSTDNLELDLEGTEMHKHFNVDHKTSTKLY